MATEKKAGGVGVMDRPHLDFSKFKFAVEKQFNTLAAGKLFRANVSKDDIWETYLSSFPAGTNEVYRERREYDCSCCRQFVRAVGDAVAIIDGKVVSIWDCDISEPNFKIVAKAMSAFVKAGPITDKFLHSEKTVGTDKNHEDLGGGKVQTWNHFFAKIPHASNTGNNHWCQGVDIATKLGEFRALHDVLLRSLLELTVDSIDTVLELIKNKSLYRGNEHEHAVKAFKKLKTEFDKLSMVDRDAFVWDRVSDIPVAVSKIRNTSIGTLLTELSDGMELEVAVGRFEKMVAPENYQRTTSLVTPSMVAKAREEIEKLGLTSALDRRYANLADIKIPDIIFANRSARKAMGDVFDSISTKKAEPKNLSKIETMTIDAFIDDIVPNVNSIEVMLENKHHNNLVSLIAPVHPTAKNMFKWDNNFTWSYNGDVADSMKEKVRKAGGNVSGDLCCRLAWFNTDDLDFHMREPGGNEIAFHNKVSMYTKGQLDVDMNMSVMKLSREPVENIFYGRRSDMKEGNYTLFVHNYCKRENQKVGFEVEIDYLGELHRFGYEKAVPNQSVIVVAEFRYTHAGGFVISKSLPVSTVSKNLWGLDTMDYHNVNVLMKSPNHWDGEKGIGNKHYFFMLDGCINDGSARGFYNEFLRTELNTHRKVLEIVGSKMKTEETSNQLSGLGFSDTTRTEILVRVKGNFTRTIRVMV